MWARVMPGVRSLRPKGLGRGARFAEMGLRGLKGFVGARPNKRMHATADTTAFIISKGAGRRVMPGVMRFN